MIDIKIILIYSQEFEPEKKWVFGLALEFSFFGFSVWDSGLDFGFFRFKPEYPKKLRSKPKNLKSKLNSKTRFYLGSNPVHGDIFLKYFKISPKMLNYPNSDGKLI